MKVTKYLGHHLVALLLTIAPLSVMSQTLAIKTNLVTDALLIPTVGIEYTLSDRHSISLQGTYNPFELSDKKWKNWSVQPELRFWKEAPMFGWFLGINVIGGGFNINNVHVGGLGDKHRQGYFMGAGFSIGYQKMLSTHWNLEFSLGGDVLLTTYDRFKDGEYEGHFRKGLILPIGTGISVVYVID